MASSASPHSGPPWRGLKVINKRYKSVRIMIAFNPITEEFATLTPVIRKNPQWIADISEYFNSESPLTFARESWTETRA